LFHKHIKKEAFYQELKDVQKRAVHALVQVYLGSKCLDYADFFGKLPAECASLFHHLPERFRN
jgi:hypothetical protein